MQTADQKSLGRLIDKTGKKLILQSQSGIFEVEVNNPDSVCLGDLIQVEFGQALQLVPNQTLHRTWKWNQCVLQPRRLHALKIRDQVETGIREFFKGRGFCETRTPLLVPCPGMEPHIRPFSVKGTHLENPPYYLPTSPEFAMKRLLVGGLERIFQITPAFRDEPISATHHPEFTLLEWYRAYVGYEQIMRDTEDLFSSIAISIFGKPIINFQGREISVKAPWPRLQVRDLFQKHVDINLVEKSTQPLLAQECRRLGIHVNTGETWDDLYFKIWMDFIEPQLPSEQAVFVTRYPASQAALAVVDQDADGTFWAKRFEIYAGGIELGNAFEELTDPYEQRNRFVKDMEHRERVYGASFPKTPLDEEFLEALTEGMPPSGGIAVGVDRMVMLYANEPDIQYTVWLNYQRP